MSVFDLPAAGKPLLVMFVAAGDAGTFVKWLPGLHQHSMETSDVVRMFQLMSRDGWWYSGTFITDTGLPLYIFQREQA